MRGWGGHRSDHWNDQDGGCGDFRGSALACLEGNEEVRAETREHRKGLVAGYAAGREFFKTEDGRACLLPGRSGELEREGLMKQEKRG